MKDVMWSSKQTPSKEKKATREVLVKTSVGLAVGLLSVFYPQTMFWGEGSLQCMVDGQKTAFVATQHGLPVLLTSSAKVNPSLPFALSNAALQVGVAKLAAIALACAGKFPGGIIFPLLYAAAPLGHALGSYFQSSSLTPVIVMCLMSSTQASVTRTPLATALILSLSASATTELSVMLPACVGNNRTDCHATRVSSGVLLWSLDLTAVVEKLVFQVFFIKSLTGWCEMK